jgi:flagellar hook-associated protein 3 FlgL
MRDLMRALATIGSMTSAQASDPNFTALVQDTTTSLNGVVTAMADDAGALGNTQSSLTATQTRLSDTATALTGQLSSVQNADEATTLSDLSAIQTQLQASYRMIANEGTLSLANFLPA